VLCNNPTGILAAPWAGPPCKMFLRDAGQVRHWAISTACWLDKALDRPATSMVSLQRATQVARIAKESH
jgi:hypothetical protein